MHKEKPRNQLFRPVSLLLSVFTLISVETRSEEGFKLLDLGKKQLDIQIAGKTVGRYMFAHDPSTSQNLHQTYKPFLHVIDPNSGTLITKGPGGQFTHHRGIYLGWNRLTTDEGRFDLWHMNKGLQVHQSFIKKHNTPESASFTSNVHWLIPEDRVVIDELRTMKFTHDGHRDTIAIIDLTTHLNPKMDLMLNGDPEHAGIQYRPANEVDKKATTYLFPKDGQDPRKDFNLPWVTEYYELNKNGYSVIHMNHPKNPNPTRYSAYRDYGRFGAFFTKSLKKGETLELHYRFVIRRGKPAERDSIQSEFEQWAK
jgi:hypothetical protein